MGRLTYWQKGVKDYADELLQQLKENKQEVTPENLLNGASSWDEYSWGGCSLIYDGDIAERLCTPSELKRTDHGRLNPNSREKWLDVQARALYQAAHMIIKGYRG